MINPPTRSEVSIERQLSPQNRNRPWTKLDDPVLVCFGGVLINSVDSGFGNREGSPYLIVVPNPKRNFLRGPKASEESKLVKIAGQLTPILVDRGDQRFGILDSEGINSRKVPPAHADTFQGYGRIEMFRVISIAELEGAP